MNTKVGNSFQAQADHINTTIGQIGEILKNHKQQIDKLTGVPSKQGTY